jgi:hypothetical protein
MAFHRLNAPLRTNESFKNMMQEDHHHGEMILTSLKTFQPVSNVVLDYMHLVLLGTLRTIMYMLLAGPLKVRQPFHIVQEMSNLMVAIASWVPSDFVRKTRSLKYVKRFKATEWRLLLFYVGVVVFSVLDKHLHEHLLVLHVAMTIVAQPNLLECFADYAHDLMFFFVKTFISVYGKDYVNHNLHNLIHLVPEAKKHGTVDKFSAFKYENFVQRLKSMVREGEQPLHQISRRYGELKQRMRDSNPKKESEKSGFHLSGLHNNGPLLLGCSNPQFSSLSEKSIGQLNLSKANCCCLLADGSIVVVENFASSEQSAHSRVIIGRKYLSQSDLYTFPCRSSLLDIFFVQNLSSLSLWPVESIKSKCFRIPFKEDFAVLPLLHSHRKD